MSPRLPRRIRSDEKGFTLIEILVVILLVSILAAIALPAFLSQRRKGQDASAKSDARNLVSQLESCHSRDQDYTSCETSQDVQESGLDLGPGRGRVEISNPDANSYTVIGHSRSGNHFTVVKGNRGPVTRTCTTADTGACSSTGSW